MDQNKLKKLCELALESREITIKEFLALPTNKYDEEVEEWVHDSYTLFMTLEDTNNNRKGTTNLLEGLFGFECVVNFS
jgi:hypothetical protein